MGQIRFWGALPAAILIALAYTLSIVCAALSRPRYAALSALTGITLLILDARIRNMSSATRTATMAGALVALSGLLMTWGTLSVLRHTTWSSTSLYAGLGLAALKAIIPYWLTLLAAANSIWFFGIPVYLANSTKSPYRIEVGRTVWILLIPVLCLLTPIAIVIISLLWHALNGSLLFPHDELE